MALSNPHFGVSVEQQTQPAHHGDAVAELRATIDSCALAYRSDLVRLLGGGPDLLGLIHRLGTGDVAGLRPGQGKTTVLTTKKGRIVERLFVNHLGEHVLLIAGAGNASRVLDHIKSYTVTERTGLADASGMTELYTLTGPRSGEALKAAGLRPPDRLHSIGREVASSQVQVLGHDGVSADGFAVLTEGGRRVWDALKQAVEEVGGRPAGSLALEASRIIRGMPAAGAELTEDYNPLEAGLWEAVSFEKGCYLGQEVVARLRTYDKVSRALWALRLPADVPAPAPGTPLFADGQEVGRITSSMTPPGWPAAVALAYVKHKRVSEGAPLEVGSAGARLRARPTALPIPMEEY